MLQHRGLRAIIVSSCPGLTELSLWAPSLQEVVLEECSDLERIRLGRAPLTRLALGTCSALACLTLSECGALVALDVTGCGQLQALHLEGCTSLQQLQAPFCCSLGGSALAAALSARPPLQRLLLSACGGLSSEALAALGCLPCLRELDLSYVPGVVDLQPVIQVRGDRGGWGQGPLLHCASGLAHERSAPAGWAVRALRSLGLAVLLVHIAGVCLQSTLTITGWPCSPLHRRARSLYHSTWPAAMPWMPPA